MTGGAGAEGHRSPHHTPRKSGAASRRQPKQLATRLAAAAAALLVLVIYFRHRRWNAEQLRKCPGEGRPRAQRFGHSAYSVPMDYRGVIPAWASPMGFLLACEELSPAAIAWVLEDEARSPGDEYLWGFLGARGDPKAAGQAFQLEAVLRMLHEQARRRPSTQWRCLRGADAARVNPPTTWEQLDERRVKIGMIMAASDNASRWADNVAEKRSYAERHGYGFHMFINLRAPGRTPHYNKVLAMLSVLHMYDWIMMSDLDAIIMQPDVLLESFIDPRYDIVASVDCNGANSGVVFYRNSTWTSMFLVESYTHDRADILQSQCYHEQAAFQWLVNDYRIRNHVKFLPNKLFNSYHSAHCGLRYSPGDFMLHFAGGKKDMAQNIFRAVVPAAQPQPEPRLPKTKRAAADEEEGEGGRQLQRGRLSKPQLHGSGQAL